MPPKGKGGGKNTGKGKKKGRKDAEKSHRPEGSESSVTSDTGADQRVVAGSSGTQAGQQPSELAKALEESRLKNLELQRALEESRAAQAGGSYAQ